MSTVVGGVVAANRGVERFIRVGRRVVEDGSDRAGPRRGQGLLRGGGDQETEGAGTARGEKTRRIGGREIFGR